MNNLDEQKETVAKKALHYVADLLGQKRISMKDSLNMVRFLSAGVEGAETEEDLKKLKPDLKMVYNNLPEFDPGL